MPFITAVFRNWVFLWVYYLPDVLKVIKWRYYGDTVDSTLTLFFLPLLWYSFETIQRGGVWHKWQGNQVFQALPLPQKGQTKILKAYPSHPVKLSVKNNNNHQPNKKQPTRKTQDNYRTSWYWGLQFSYMCVWGEATLSWNLPIPYNHINIKIFRIIIITDRISLTCKSSYTGDEFVPHGVCKHTHKHTTVGEAMAYLCMLMSLCPICTFLLFIRCSRTKIRIKMQLAIFNARLFSWSFFSGNILLEDSFSFILYLFLFSFCLSRVPFYPLSYFLRPHLTCMVYQVKKHCHHRQVFSALLILKTSLTLYVSLSILCVFSFLIKVINGT